MFLLSLFNIIQIMRKLEGSFLSYMEVLLWLFVVPVIVVVLVVSAAVAAFVLSVSATGCDMCSVHIHGFLTV